MASTGDSRRGRGAGRGCAAIRRGGRGVPPWRAEREMLNAGKMPGRTGCDRGDLHVAGALELLEMTVPSCCGLDQRGGDDGQLPPSCNAGRTEETAEFFAAHSIRPPT